MLAAMSRVAAGVHSRCTATALVLLVFGSATVAAADVWSPVRWNGEQAYVATTATLKAIVSIERGRLVHLSPADSDDNLLFAPATRNEPTGWGGHRVWLGPQLTWRATWPPPAAWEKSAAEQVRADGARLELAMPDAGDGWPRLTRVYAIVAGRLACGVRVSGGGTRDAQVVQILQTLPKTTVDLRPAPGAAAPLGFLLAPPISGRTHALVPTADTEQMTRTETGVRLRYITKMEKLAFPPQEIVAHSDAVTLRVARGQTRGTEVGAPDEGFYTQVYLGDNHAPFVELEQLSPLWKAGEPAEFGTIIQLGE